MAGLLFGTGGVPNSSKTKSTAGGIQRIGELGLGCMEIEFVHGVNMNEPMTVTVSKAAAKAKVKLTAHGPYYINLNAREPEKIKASQERIYQTARVGALCGAFSVVFHAAVYMGDTPEKTYATVKKSLEEVSARLKNENNQVWLRPEVMGKPSQFGSLDEILDLSKEVERVLPCIDFAHWHARTGKFNSFHEFDAVLARVERRLGRLGLDNIHIHLSGIAFSDKGEIKHLNLIESDFKYLELLEALKARDAKGVVICESPNLEEDAMLLQAAYSRL